MDLYADNILDHYKHPRSKGTLQHPSASHREENLSCGDDLTIDLKLEKEKIVDIAWRGEGCAISQAAMSILSEELAGKTESEINALQPKDIYDFLGVPVGPRRFKCALLCLHTLKNALRTSKGQAPQSWVETVSLEN